MNGLNSIDSAPYLGRFDRFKGCFIEAGQNPVNEKLEVKIDIFSIHSSHVKCDTHLRKDFLNVEVRIQADLSVHASLTKQTA